MITLAAFVSGFIFGLFAIAALIGTAIVRTILR